MVMVPLLVVKLNWACTMTGNATESSMSSIFVTQPVLAAKGCFWDEPVVINETTFKVTFQLMKQRSQAPTLPNGYPPAAAIVIGTR